MSNIKLACIVVMCMAVVWANTQTATAITCGQVSGNLVGCVGYLQNGGPVPPRCCNGIRNIMAAARTTFDRRTTCNCLKAAAGQVRGINPANAQSLPSKCGVNIPYKIGTSINCARYIHNSFTLWFSEFDANTLNIYIVFFHF